MVVDLVKKEKTRIRSKRLNQCKSYNISLDQCNRLKSSCELCGWKYNINIHHIIQKKKGGRNDITNYIGLCCNCHKLIHNKKTVAQIEYIHSQFYKEKFQECKYVLIEYKTPCKNCCCEVTEVKGMSGKTYYFHPNNARNCVCGCKKPEPTECQK